jgi:hypothetical protein
MKSEKDTMITLPVLGNLTYREWHGFVDGFYVGVVDGNKENDYTKEQHSWRGRYFVSIAMRWAVLISVYYKLTNDTTHNS